MDQEQPRILCATRDGQAEQRHEAAVQIHHRGCKGRTRQIGRDASGNETFAAGNLKVMPIQRLIG